MPNRADSLDTSTEMPIPDEFEFVAACQTSSSIDEICAKTGLARGTVINRRQRYKNKHGVPLKDLRRATNGRSINWEAVRRLAMSLATSNNGMTSVS